MKKINIYKIFDYLGFPVFIFLFADAIYDISLGINTWRVWVRLIICFLGMIIDGYLIFFYREQDNQNPEKNKDG